MNNPSLSAFSPEPFNHVSPQKVQVMTTFDLNKVIKQTGFNKTSRHLLERAINKYGWQPTSISQDGDVINLMSEDGLASAQLVISESKWNRISG